MPGLPHVDVFPLVPLVVPLPFMISPAKKTCYFLDVSSRDRDNDLAIAPEAKFPAEVSHADLCHDLRKRLTFPALIWSLFITKQVLPVQVGTTVATHSDLMEDHVCERSNKCDEN